MKNQIEIDDEIELLPGEIVLSPEEVEERHQSIKQKQQLMEEKQIAQQVRTEKILIAREKLEMIKRGKSFLNISKESNKPSVKVAVTRSLAAKLTCKN